MQFTASLTMLAAVAFNVVQAEIGCTVDLSLNGSPGDSGEVILFAILDRFEASVHEGVSSDCCNWGNTLSAPYSVLFYSGIESNYSSDAELAAVLDPWVGTYLRSGTDTPDSSSPADYLVRSVTCA